MVSNLLMKKIKIVLIKWIDSCGVIGHWEKYDELEPLKPINCESIGYLDDNKKYKAIVQSVSENKVLGRLTIPVKSIISITDI